MCRDHSRIYLPSNMQARRVNGLGWTEPSARTALSAPLHEPSSVNRVACTVPQGMPSQGTLPGLPMRPMSLPPPGMPPHSSQHPRPPLSMLPKFSSRIPPRSSQHPWLLHSVIGQQQGTLLTPPPAARNQTQPDRRQGVTGGKGSNGGTSRCGGTEAKVR